MDGETQRRQLPCIDAPKDIANPKLQRDRQRTRLDNATLIAMGQAATRHLESLIAPGQIVTLEGDMKKRDRYGRIPVRACGQGSRTQQVDSAIPDVSRGAEG